MDAAVGPEEAELVHREPDEREVEELDVGDPCGEPQEVHRHGGSRERGERAPAEPVVQLQQGGGERHHRQVDPDEPEGLGDQPQGHARQPPTAAEKLDDERGHAPDQHEDHGGPQQALQPGPQEGRVHRAGGVLGAPAEQGPVGQGVGEAADEEEHRHHLKDPGEQLELRHDGEEVADPVGGDGGHQPVAEDDRAEREDAQEVYVAIPGDGCRLGQVAHVCSHAHTVAPCPRGRQRDRTHFPHEYPRSDDGGPRSGRRGDPCAAAGARRQQGVGDLSGRLLVGGEERRGRPRPGDQRGQGARGGARREGAYQRGAQGEGRGLEVVAQGVRERGDVPLAQGGQERGGRGGLGDVGAAWSGGRTPRTRPGWRARRRRRRTPSGRCRRPRRRSAARPGRRRGPHRRPG